MAVYLDVFLPKTKSWVRVDVELARKDNNRRLNKKSKKADNDLLTTASDSEEDKE